MKKVWLVVAALALPTLAHAQVPTTDQRQRREELEAQITQRFLEHVSTELQLEAASRSRLEQHLRQSAPRRRSLAVDAVQLRGELLRAARDERTPDSEFARMINEMTKLRDQEVALWKSDQEALSRILTPRQHARFMVMWMRFNDQVRDMALRRGPGGPRRH